MGSFQIDHKKLGHKIIGRALQDLVRCAGLLDAAMSIENRAIRYYTDAAEKIRALPEVSRTLKTLAKKHTKRLGQLQRLGER